MSRRVPIELQLDEFREHLELRMSHWFIFHCDYTHWEEMDTHTNEFTVGLENEIDGSFFPITDRWIQVPKVSEMLENLRVLIQNSAWAAINVPFPRDPYMHLDRVVMNIMIIYYEQIEDIWDEMVRATHRVEVIQRTWRTCVADPNYTVCRNRLRREAGELVNGKFRL
jgi:hypothetical protein